MLLFAHTGLTLGAAAAVDLVNSKRKDKTARWLPFLTLNIDVRWLLIGSMLPDLDKIIGIYLFPNISNGRIFLHTLLFLLIIFLAGVIIFRLRRRTWGLVLAVGTSSHLILDSMWRSPRTLFWPFMQKSFAAVETEGWIETVWKRLFVEAGLYIPEIMGTLILLWFFIWALNHRQLGKLLSRGRVKF